MSKMRKACVCGGFGEIIACIVTSVIGVYKLFLG